MAPIPLLLGAPFWIALVFMVTSITKLSFIKFLVRKNCQTSDNYFYVTFKSERGHGSMT